MSRTKEKFIEMTGGLRFDETPEQTQDRLAKIQNLNKKIRKGTASELDMSLLNELTSVTDGYFEEGSLDEHQCICPKYD
ncbi:hypothetical protein [Bathymodiolus thermophilus thioautotrophic gill symbiont]|uniref:Uncharacterized protein n=1 Tax=Bathymodiolus thermophilus thioautotrophic gill symbiont TaxID=2360 RepID=A0A1J5UM66_9GAMM|nr:hypothetical protein [Bathymodiolus thermophilus thioautotrophic gill symbiont]OIR25319.1 hypothetical protein BGC33_13195 [Bathymodiolus thermophilus thioautotrophic gill symbiont]